MTTITDKGSEQSMDPIFRKSIEHLSCEEFDGHTNFALLSPEDKLHWLSEIARFLYEHRKGQKLHE